MLDNPIVTKEINISTPEKPKMITVGFNAVDNADNSVLVFSKSMEIQ